MVHSGGTIRLAALPSWGREASRIDTHTGEGEAQEGTCGRCRFVLGAVVSVTPGLGITPHSSGAGSVGGSWVSAELDLGTVL